MDTDIDGYLRGGGFVLETLHEGTCCGGEGEGDCFGGRGGYIVACFGEEECLGEGAKMMMLWG